MNPSILSDCKTQHGFKEVADHRPYLPGWRVGSNGTIAESRRGFDNTICV